MITAIFSTYNGAKVLPQMLESLTRLEAPAGGFKVIAVNNASTDETAAILESYKDRLPLTVLYEAGKGKNRAINQALPLAEGDFYIFCDDDIVVPPDWLKCWREVADANAEYDVFGGVTLPLWPEEPSPWILNEVNHGIAFATHSDNQAEGACRPSTIHGTNMAVRASLFADGLKFDTEIGPDGTAAYAMGSEAALSQRLWRAGHKCWLTRKAPVRHIIRREQMTRDWLIRRAYRFGKGEFMLYGRPQLESALLALKNTVKGIVFPLLLPRMSEAAAWRRMWQWCVDRGYEDGARQARGLPPRWDGAGLQIGVRAQRQAG